MEQLTPDWRGAVALPKAMEAKAGSRNEVSSDPGKRGTRGINSRF